MEFELLNNLRRAFSNYYHLKDDYLEKIRSANAGMLHQGNLHCFDFAIQRLPSNNPILEIGTFCGLSANVITYFKRKHQKRNVLITTDKLQSDHHSGNIGSSDFTYAEFSKYVVESLKKNLMTFSKNDLPYVIQKSSDDFFVDWGDRKFCADIFGRELRLGGRIAFAYIDGNHSYRFVNNDYKNCDKYLEVGGFILFDDSADYSKWEVKRVIRDIKANPSYKMVMKNPNYLFQKVR
jgi:hypothetical protein